MVVTGVLLELDKVGGGDDTTAERPGESVERKRVKLMTGGKAYACGGAV